MRLSLLPLLVAIITLLIFSLTSIWSTANHDFPDQLLFSIIAIFLIFIISRLDLSLILTFSNIYYVLSIILLIATLIIGRVTRGSTRWFDLGIYSLQASEFVKPLLAIFFAKFITTHPPDKLSNILQYLLLTAIPVGLVFIQPDLGSALVIMTLSLSILFISGLRYRYLILGLIMSLIIFIPLFSLLKPYQQVRLTSFINPYSDPSHTGYNIIQSIIAIGSGKIVGLGVRQGTQSHLKFLPERHTDFIFASFAEEFGIIGSSLLVICLIVILMYLLKLATKLKDTEEIALCISIFAIFAFQSVVNLGMNLGVMPVTGITLPLVSYGGSSLISFGILLGLVVNLNRRH
jgi:rod shape determining protein RodA